MPKGNCEFKATGGQYFSTVILHLALFGLFSLGLYIPWALVRLFKLKASHTTIQGKETTFSGTGGPLFVLLLINGLLTLVTLGLYGPWAFCRIYRWKAENTLVEGTPSRFSGTGGGLFVLYLLHLFLLPMITFGFYYLVGMYRFHAWREEHTRYGGKDTSFGAGLGPIHQNMFVDLDLEQCDLRPLQPMVPLHAVPMANGRAGGGRQGTGGSFPPGPHQLAGRGDHVPHGPCCWRRLRDFLFWIRSNS